MVVMGQVFQYQDSQSQPTLWYHWGFIHCYFDEDSGPKTHSAHMADDLETDFRVMKLLSSIPTFLRTEILGLTELVLKIFGYQEHS